MTILAPATHKVLLKVSGTQTTLPDIGHAFVRDFFAAQMLSAGILPVVIQNADPGVSRLIIWFDPNGATTVDAETAQGSFKISNDGATWITDPTAVQWRTWLQFYLGGSSGGGDMKFIAARQAGTNITTAGVTIVGNNTTGYTITYPVVGSANDIIVIAGGGGTLAGGGGPMDGPHVAITWGLSAKNTTTATVVPKGAADNGSGGVGGVPAGDTDFIVFRKV